MDNDLIPVFSEFGAAIYDAQVLEQGLKFLMVLVSHFQRLHFPSLSETALHGKEEKQTLGMLFNAVKKKEYFTDTEEQQLRRAIKIRNLLAHTFMTDKSAGMATPNGRHEVLEEIMEYRETIQQAGLIVDRLIDKYLSEYGTTIEETKKLLENYWVSDNGENLRVH